MQDAIGEKFLVFTDCLTIIPCQQSFKCALNGTKSIWTRNRGDRLANQPYGFVTECDLHAARMSTGKSEPTVVANRRVNLFVKCGLFQKRQDKRKSTPYAHKCPQVGEGNLKSIAFWASGG
jgi:hypothetical protein